MYTYRNIYTVVNDLFGNQCEWLWMQINLINQKINGLIRLLPYIFTELTYLGTVTWLFWAILIIFITFTWTKSVNSNFEKNGLIWLFRTYIITFKYNQTENGFESSYVPQIFIISRLLLHNYQNVTFAYIYWNEILFYKTKDKRGNVVECCYTKFTLHTLYYKECPSNSW